MNRIRSLARFPGRFMLVELCRRVSGGVRGFELASYSRCPNSQLVYWLAWCACMIVPRGGWRCRRAICSVLTINSVRVWSAIDHPTIRRLAGRATRRPPTATSSAPGRPPTRQFSPREVPGRTGTLCWEDVLPGEVGRGSFQGLDFHFQYTVLASHLGQFTTLVTG